MELKPAKRKKLTAPQNSLFIPDSTRSSFVAVFSGSCCWVKSHKDMTDLYQMGFYGKGSLSKSEPVFNQRNDGLPDIIYRQQWLNRKRLTECKNEELCMVDKQKLDLASTSLEKFWKSAQCFEKHEWGVESNKADKPSSANIPSWKLSKVETIQRGELHELVDHVLQTGQLKKPVKAAGIKEMVVVDENGPRFETYTAPPLEFLQLTLEEAFFLSGALGKLLVFDEANREMTVQEMWLKFQQYRKDFIQKYVIYYWFRTRGWVVRSGLKYGGDFLLYEKGLDFTHSTYLVHVLDNETQLQWEDFALMQRLVETFKKDILFCIVIKPPDVRDDDLKQPDVINKLRVREVMCRRWIPSQQRDVK